MVENAEFALNTSQPELLHMLWNLPVLLSLINEKSNASFFLFQFLAFIPTHTSGFYQLLSHHADDFAESLCEFCESSLCAILYLQLAFDPIIQKDIAAD